MKFRKTFWINIILLLILSSSFSTQIIAQNPQFVTFPVNILMILLLLTPILTNISLSTANTNKLNWLSIILCMVSLIAAFYFLASGATLIASIIHSIPVSLSIIALFSQRYKQDFFIDFRLFLVSFFR
jgi:hypothetical protein